MTQTHGDPGGPFVKGSEHVNDVQSGKKKRKDFLKHVVGTNIEMNNNIETEADTTVPSFGGGGGKA